MWQERTTRRIGRLRRAPEDQGDQEGQMYQEDQEDRGSIKMKRVPSSPQDKGVMSGSFKRRSAGPKTGTGRVARKATMNAAFKRREACRPRPPEELHRTKLPKRGSRRSAVNRSQAWKQSRSCNKRAQAMHVSSSFGRRICIAGGGVAPPGGTRATQPNYVWNSYGWDLRERAPA